MLPYAGSPSPACEYMQSSTDLLSVTFFFLSSAHNRNSALKEIIPYLYLNSMIILKLLYLVSIGYRGFAHLNVKLYVFVLNLCFIYFYVFSVLMDAKADTSVHLDLGFQEVLCIDLSQLRSYFCQLVL